MNMPILCMPTRMRISLPRLGGLALAVLLSACQAKSPKGVAEQYLKAFHHHDYEKAKEYSTPDTRKLLDMFISFAALTPDSLKQNINFAVLDEKVAGDTAYVRYRVEGSDKVQSLTLVKADGEWKVGA